MQDYRQDILDIHRKIEDDLDFVLDVDNIAVKEYYNMLDELDSCYINIEKDNDEKIITLYNSEEEGLEYLNKLNKLSFFIRKKVIELYLKKIKMLLRRKKKREELLIILRLLKKWEEFYLENKNEFTYEEQNKIEKCLNEIENIKDDKIVIKKPTIKDNIKLTTMIGITEVVGACKMVINRSSKDKIIKEVSKIKREEKIDDNIKITPVPKTVHVTSYVKKVGVSNDKKKNIEKNSDVVEKRQDEKKEDYKDIIDIEVIDKEEQKEKNDKRSIKDDIKVASAIALGAEAVVVLPTVLKTVAAVEALKVMTEEVKDNDDIKEDVVKDINYLNDQEDIKEITEFVEELETEDIEDREEEILKENGVEEEIKKESSTSEENKKEDVYQENIEEKKDSIHEQENVVDDKLQEQENMTPLTKKERFEILKMNFINNEEINTNNNSKKEVLRVKKEEKKVKKKIKKQQRVENRKKNPIKKFVSKIGRVAFLLSMNIALANILQKQVAKDLVIGKPKVLK